MNNLELLTSAANLSLPALVDLLGMAAFGAIIVAAACEWSARATKRVLLDKYAQQTASMALQLLLLCVAGSAAVIVPATKRFPALKQWIADFNSPVVHIVALFAVAALLLAIWSPLWKKMRKQKGAHSFIGILAAVVALAAIAFGTVAGTFILPALESGNALAWPHRLPLFTWALVGQYAFTALSAGAGLSLVYLVLRRNKDDFGRDYYRFGLKQAASWAYVPMLIQLAFQAWLVSMFNPEARQLILEGPLGIFWGVAVLCALLCTGLWLLMARSESPMRLKWTAFFGAFLLWVMHTANVFLFLNLTGIM